MPLGKFINKVGFELEGGWTAEAHKKACKVAGEYGTLFTGDGSVHLFEHECRGPDERHPWAGGWKGELPSSAYEDLEKAKAFLLGTYPDILPTKWASDDNCGFHIHISMTRPSHYQRLMQRRFFEAVYTFWAAWGKEKAIPAKEPFWHRLANESLFCRSDYQPDEQVRLKSKASVRYSGVNYCHAMHGTLELRLLPMFLDSNLAVAALEAWVKFVEGWCADRSTAIPKTTRYFKKVLEFTEEYNSRATLKEAEPAEWTFSATQELAGGRSFQQPENIVTCDEIEIDCTNT